MPGVDYNESSDGSVDGSDESDVDTDDISEVSDSSVGQENEDSEAQEYTSDEDVSEDVHTGRDGSLDGGSAEDGGHGEITNLGRPERDSPRPYVFAPVQIGTLKPTYLTRIEQVSRTQTTTNLYSGR